MTPAKQTIYIDTATGRVQLAATGSAPPDLNFILRTGANLEIAFVTAGVVVALEAESTGRLVIKEIGDGDGPALFLDTAWEKSGSETTTRYLFKGEMDGAAIRTALATGLNKKFGASILFQQPSEDYPGASLPFEVTVHQNHHRTDDTAPIVSNDVSLVLNDDETAIEVIINGTSKGFLHVFTTAP